MAVVEGESPGGGGDGAGEPSAAGGGVGGGVGGGDPRQSPKVSTYTGKSCKGCLYYSSLRKDQARNPICAGISRTMKQVPGYIVGESEVEATKVGRNLSDFKYACVGYSVFLNNKDAAGNKQGNRAELPLCVGIELLVDRRTATADHVPAHVHNKEDGAVRSQPREHKPAVGPAQATKDQFFSRFTRNAGLVASGVSRNLHRVGNYIKHNLDDAMYPYRRRPK